MSFAPRLEAVGGAARQGNRPPRSCYVRVSRSKSLTVACAFPRSGAAPSTFSGSISCQSMRSTASSAASAIQARR
ncbi:MAG: hypothetical protein QOF89_780 [Acidobacteriota bacterium]|nr:hypothetical protein [Acidobacteriota bacterium]